MYVNVVIDNKSDATDRLYTYVCDIDGAEVGSKVYVPFGLGKKLKAAYVFELLSEIPEGQPENKLKKVDSVDGAVRLSAEAVECCRWMKRRYLCRYIEAINCFIPAGAASKRGKKRLPKHEAVGSAEQKVEALTAEQEKVTARLSEALAGKSAQRFFLLHGVTGSGKTEIYMRAIEESCKRGRGAIMLVPEISLTPQLIERFTRRFGEEKIALLHSKLSMGERYDEWQRIASGSVRIVIGARSAVFAPLENIGIIVLDEEHESSYKSDMSPKYETVEVAAKRALSQKPEAVLLLGSATPSVVSYKRAEQGIYEKLELTKRYNDVLLPEVHVADMRRELREGNRSIFSAKLSELMEKSLSEGKQAMLFLNRRGYSNFVSCRECGYVLKCENCDIALTYHKERGRALCHYCGRSMRVPELCPECGSRELRHFGLGTEKLEEAVNERFPGYITARLDLDTARRKGSAERILRDFGRGKSDILLGTQLIAKGLDFKNIGVVGIVSADISLNIPDFRSAERTFQLITQAAGRAGRGSERGSVVIQSYMPEHYAIRAAAENDYAGFYRAEDEMRKLLLYPPYSDLIRLSCVDEDEEIAEENAREVRERLIRLLGKKRAEENVFEVQRAYVAKTEGKYRYHILIKAPKAERGIYMGAIAKIKEENTEKGRKKGSGLLVDVNPY